MKSMRRSASLVSYMYLSSSISSISFDSSSFSSYPATISPDIIFE
ncbi:hypothetical protein [Methanobrevibacter sp.]